MIPMTIDDSGPVPVVTLLHEPPAPQPDVDPYTTVQTGETLSGIAQQYGETLPQIEADNPQLLKTSGSWNEIYTGERVYVGKHRQASNPVPAPAPAVTHPSVPPPAPVIVAGTDYENLVTLAKFLVANGYSKAAAAGVAACVAGESQGNPESVGSGGGGLIGWTPLPAGLVTGNPNIDLANQLHQIIQYNNANGNVAALNSIGNPLSAADYYSRVFERPAVLYSDVVSSVAYSVYAAIGG